MEQNNSCGVTHRLTDLNEKDRHKILYGYLIKHQLYTSLDKEKKPQDLDYILVWKTDKIVSSLSSAGGEAVRSNGKEGQKHKKNPVNLANYRGKMQCISHYTKYYFINPEYAKRLKSNKKYHKITIPRDNIRKALEGIDGFYEAILRYYIYPTTRLSAHEGRNLGKHETRIANMQKENRRYHKTQAIEAIIQRLIQIQENL